MKTPEIYRVTQSKVNHKTQYLSQWVSELHSGNNGAFIIPNGKGSELFCIASDGYGWDHVSVSVIGRQRCPNWEEMSLIKSLFWEGEDTVMQLHPPESQYVNNHNFCLHLWRPQKSEIPLPHSILVGIKN